MVTIGVDAHKQVHVAVAVDERGREVQKWEGANSEKAWQEVLLWAGQWDERQWGIEGSGGYGQGLARRLVRSGETVYEVNPRLTAHSRRRARRQDKSDRLDAHAVARVVLRDGEDLPRVEEQNGDAAALDLLARERERVKSQTSRLRNQLHNRLFQDDPEYKKRFRSLSKLETVKRLERYAQDAASPLERVRAEGVRRAASALRLFMEQEAELKREIEALARERFAALAAMNGVAMLTAGALAGVLGTRSFASADQLAAYAGAAPLETSSAGSLRHRLSRDGNRRLNSLLYRIALTQWQCGGDGRAYIERRMAEGKSWLEAVRALKPFIARALWRIWQQQYAQQPPQGPSLAAS